MSDLGLSVCGRWEERVEALLLDQVARQTRQAVHALALAHLRTHPHNHSMCLSVKRPENSQAMAPRVANESGGMGV